MARALSRKSYDVRINVLYAERSSLITSPRPVNNGIPKCAAKRPTTWTSSLHAGPINATIFCLVIMSYAFPSAAVSLH